MGGFDAITSLPRLRVGWFKFTRARISPALLSLGKNGDYSKSIPYPTVCFASVPRSFAYGWKTINVSFKEFKGKTLPLSCECLRRKYLEKLCDIYKSYYKLCVLYDQCDNTLTKRFHRDEKILILSSSVVCLSFTILNIFENNRGLVKILVYSFVFDN